MKGLVDELQDHIHSSIQPHQDLARQTENVLRARLSSEGAEQEYLNGLYGSFQTCRDELYASLRLVRIRTRVVSNFWSIRSQQSLLR